MPGPLIPMGAMRTTAQARRRDRFESGRSDRIDSTGSGARLATLGAVVHRVGAGRSLFFRLSSRRRPSSRSSVPVNVFCH